MPRAVKTSFAEAVTYEEEQPLLPDKIATRRRLGPIRLVQIGADILLDGPEIRRLRGLLRSDEEILIHLGDDVLGDENPSTRGGQAR